MNETAAADNATVDTAADDTDPSNRKVIAAVLAERMVLALAESMVPELSRILALEL